MTAMTTPRHRVASATAQMRDVADSVVDASVWSMDASETRTTLVELTRLEAQVGELKARVAAHADDLQVGEDVGATNTACWLAHQTKQTRPEAHRVVALGHDLEAHPVTRDALAAGAVLERSLPARSAPAEVDEVAQRPSKTARVVGRACRDRRSLQAAAAARRQAFARVRRARVELTAGSGHLRRDDLNVGDEVGATSRRTRRAGR